MDLQRLKGLNVANHLEKRSLLVAINSIAALSIFFFGYDQGMMGGVNVSGHSFRGGVGPICC